MFLLCSVQRPPPALESVCVRFYLSQSQPNGQIICGIAVGLVLSVFQKVDSTANVCESPKCVQEAAKIIDSVDSIENPCTNPYAFACEKLVENSKVEGNGYGIDNMAHIMWFKKLKAIYLEEVHENDHKIVKVAKKLFQECLGLYSQDILAIKETFKQLGGWPVLEGSSWNEADFDWLNATYTLRRLGYSFGAFLDVEVELSAPNTFRIFQGRNHYTKIEDLVEIIQLFEEQYNKETLQKDATDVYQFSKDFNELHNMDYKYGNDAIEVIQKTEGIIDWLAFINNITYPAVAFTKDDYISYPQNQQITRITELISKTPKRVLANYLMWQAVAPLIIFVPNVSPALRDPEFCLHTAYSKIFTKGVNPIDIIMLRRYLSEEKKKGVENIALDIIAKAIESFPKTVDQMFIDKLKKVRVLVGMNANYFDDKVLDEFQVDLDFEDSANFFELLAQVNTNYLSAKYVKARKPVQQNYASSYSSSPIFDQDVNIFYIPPSVTSSYFYDENRPQYLNYGILGTVLATNFLFHIRNIMDIENSFYNVTECLLKDMKPDAIMGDIHNRELVKDIIESNLAEQISYAAYEKWVKHNSDEKNLIAIEYTPKQLFWISAASIICGTKEHRLHQEDIDVLSGSLRQNPNFAKDFNCPPNSEMNPTIRCNLI